MLHLPQILDATEIQQASALLAGAPWADGRTSAGRQAAQVKNNEQLPPDCEQARALQALVVRGLDRSPQFMAAALPKKLFPPRFNRYSEAASHYGRHVDNAVRFTDNGVRVRTDLSCTLFLSDPASYDGGELVVHGAGARQQAKLSAGDAVLYAGTSVHEVLPVTRGERFAAFFWIESMVRSGEQRQLLHEMDLALMALRDSGESPAAIALTGTYHNLLRMWADT
ncbi:MAG: Fe2+-dependent dioxygenase [Ramlibacter sp.]